MPVFRLSEHILFPHPELAEDNGLLAVGGDFRHGKAHCCLQVRDLSLVRQRRPDSLVVHLPPTGALPAGTEDFQKTCALSAKFEVHRYLSTGHSPRSSATVPTPVPFRAGIPGFQRKCSRHTCGCTNSATHTRSNAGREAALPAAFTESPSTGSSSVNRCFPG